MSQQRRVKTRIKLTSATFILTVGSFGYHLNLYNAPVASANLNPTQINAEEIAKRSGGRSGGGSFKRKSPSSSQRRKPSRSQNKRSSPSRSQNKRRTNPTYRREAEPSYRREPARTYRRRSSDRTYRRSSGRSGNGIFSLVVFYIIVLLVVLIIIFVVVLILKNVLSNAQIKGKNRERDNDLVTVSMLQVALLAPDNLQDNLSTLSTNTDTSTDSGLVTLMQESALILLRNEAAWTHVRSRSNSLKIDRAESVFNRLSVNERSKFTGESLTNIDGSLQVSEAKEADRGELAQHVVVTLILGTADDKPLFTKINTEAELKEKLLQLASMRDDYLFKFELLWTPQKSGEYLTDEELLLEYTDIMPLV